MIKLSNTRDLARLRRIALGSQGLLKAKPFGAGLAGAKAAIAHLGYVQIDSISVVERAHHHTLASRVPNYHPAMLQQLLLDKDIFEYWSHAAAFLPMADFRFSLPYKHAIKSGKVHWYKQPDRKLMSQLLERIRLDGPVKSRHLEKANHQSEGWWSWKPTKKALEQLYMEGDLMVCNREGFEKSYDLTERVLPSQIDTRLPSIDEFAQHLLEQQLRCHGLVSLKGLTYLRRNPALRKQVKSLLHEATNVGSLEAIQTPNGEVFYMATGLLEQPLARFKKRVSILSPFDNGVIQRDRLKAIFDFDYQIECYVPEAKRVYGYFSLPLLYGDEFIGRMDCKAHRKRGELVINALHFEPTFVESARFNQADTLLAFATAAQHFRQFQQCQSLSVNRVYPSWLQQPVEQALRA